jgi:FlaA1/EpsC-like NDP-sugar epimerase
VKTPNLLSTALLRVRNRHLIAADLVLLPMAAVLAFALRLDAMQLQPYVQTMLIYAIAAPLIKLPIFAGLGIYSRFWQYAGADEMMLLVWSAAIGALAQGALFLGAQAFFPSLLVPGVPRSIPLIDVLVTFAVIAAPRFALRAGALNAQRSGKGGAPRGPLQNVLIVGAGEAGALVVRELRQNPQMGLIPVGFIDDDPGKHGVLLNRVRVLGGRGAIPSLVRERAVDQVIIAMPSAAGKTIREIVTICEDAGVRARIVPGIYELLGGGVKVNQLRDVQIDDLLRREPVQTDTAQVEGLLRGKRVLVTGAGGSIGSELCRQIIHCCPSSLVLLGHGENSIFEIHNELRAELDGPNAPCPPGQKPALIPVIADVRFAERLRAVFDAYRPEVVFHAAAHKHVPLMEANLADAITNNVLGTLRVVEASAAVGVGRLVLISTDKAVNPTSIMGATKRVAELITQDAARRTGCAYVAVRFGNVLGSRGSVVPFFQKQIAAGGPVTVTHPEVRRYFMTIPEAVQLVLQAATMGRGSEVFVLDMGEPVRILDLARDLIRLSGLEPDRDIEIKYTGLRPGEKLFEELFSTGEDYGRTEHEKIFRYRNGHGKQGEDGLSAQLDALFVAARRQDDATMLAALRDLVPEYIGEERAAS